MTQTGSSEGIEDFKTLYNADHAERLKQAVVLSPFFRHMGIRVDDIGPGFITCSLEAGEHLWGSPGLVHGGAVAALVDSALTLAVFPLTGGRDARTLEYKINYLGKVEKGRCTATARVRSLKQQVAVALVEVTNDGRTVASAQGTVFIREARARRYANQVPPTPTGS
ncbi:MAG: PaaI family thioesterase [Nitrospirae bacterium]|nr:PaaI family thioesterase [Nitrospirota bacterium]